MSSTKYETELAAEVAELTAERDRARGLAVALEGQLARVAALAAVWQGELDRGEIRTSCARYCWGLAAADLRAALDPEAGS